MSERWDCRTRHRQAVDCAAEAIHTHFRERKEKERTEISIVSLGYRCLTAALLNKHGFRKESFPLDWMASSSLEGLLTLLASEWEGFLSAEAWCHVENYLDSDGRSWASICNCAHRGIASKHLLQAGQSFEEMSPALTRRVERFRLLAQKGLLRLVRVEPSPPADVAVLAEAVALATKAPLLLVVPEAARERCLPVSNVVYEYALGKLGAGSPSEDESGLDWAAVFARALRLTWSEEISTAAHDRCRLARRAFRPGWRPAPPDFDAVAYRALNAELADLSEEACLLHYCQAGMLPLGFSTENYRALNPDLASFDDDFCRCHYKNHGCLEGRRWKLKPLPSGFSAEEYRALNEDLASFDDDFCVFHYRAFGAEEGRAWKQRASDVVVA